MTLNLSENSVDEHGNIAARLCHKLGKYHEHRMRIDESIAWHTRAYRQTPTASHTFSLGNALYRKQNYSDALPYLRAAVLARPTKSLWEDRYIYAAKRVANLDNELLLYHLPPRALTELSLARAEGLRNAGDDSSALDLYLQLRQHLDTYDADSELNSFIDQAIYSLTPTSAPAWQRLERHKQALLHNTDDFKWQTKHGDLAFGAKQYLEAAEHYAVATELSPKAEWTAYKAAFAFEVAESSRQNGAYEIAIGRDTLLNSKQLGRGVFHERAHRYARAADTFAYAYQHEADPILRNQLAKRAALNFQAALDYDEARKWLTVASSLQPNDTDIAIELARTEYLQGNWERASQIAEGQTLKPDCPAVAKQIYILSLLCLGKTKKALRVITSTRVSGESGALSAQHSVRTKPAFWLERMPSLSLSAEGYEEWGDFYAAQGKHVDSQTQYLKALDVADPNSEPSALKKLSPELLNHEKAARASWHVRASYAETPVLPRLTPVNQGANRSDGDRYKEYVDSLPVRSDFIVYESNLGLSVDCNPLALYRELRGIQGFRHYWIVQPGTEIPKELLACSDTTVVFKNTKHYVRLLATAKYLINNSTFPTYFTRRTDQHYLMTWHGTPLKTLAKDQPAVMPHANIARNLLQASHVIVPNSHTKQVLLEGSDVHGLLTAEVRLTGYPRNDALIHSAKTIDPNPHLEFASNQSSRTAATALIAPTWRDDRGLDSQISTIQSAAAALQAAGYEVVVRAHHYVEHELLRRDDTLHVAPRPIPTNDLLPTVDLLVTDYSSIYFDFALTGRPIVFLTHDWDDYCNTRGVYFSKEELPGTVCDSLDALPEALASIDIEPNRLREFTEQFAPRDDGNATQRVVQFLFENVNVEQSRDTGNRMLFRQSFIPNGMSSAFANLCHALVADDSIVITAMTDARLLQQDPSRHQTLRTLPSRARVLGRIGALTRSQLDEHVQRALLAEPATPHTTLRRHERRVFNHEARRCTGNTTFSAAIEYDGYSEFMAKYVLGYNYAADVTSVVLHSDIAKEARLRAPELGSVARLYSEFDKVLSVSPTLSEINKASFAMRGGDARFDFIRNLIRPAELEQLAAEPLPTAISTFVESSVETIVFVGRLSPEKNVSAILRSFNRVVEHRPEASLLLLGDGPLRTQLSHEAEELLPQGSYMFAGHCSNPYPMLKRASAMVMASHHEGMPMVILESLSVGTPVIAMDIPSLAEFETFSGVAIVPRNTVALSDAILNELSRNSPVQFDGNAYLSTALSDFSRQFTAESL